MKYIIFYNDKGITMFAEKRSDFSFLPNDDENEMIIDSDVLLRKELLIFDNGKPRLKTELELKQDKDTKENRKKMKEQLVDIIKDKDKNITDRLDAFSELVDLKMIKI